MAGKGLPVGERGEYKTDYISWTPKHLMQLYVDIIELCVCSGMSPHKVARHMGLSHPYVNKIFRKYRPMQGTKDATLTLMSGV